MLYITATSNWFVMDSGVFCAHFSGKIAWPSFMPICGMEVFFMSKVLMVQGTMSNAGKSMLVAGLCRIFLQDGYRVAPFKSQNMALNSFVTREGLEMGRAQVMQAEAAGIEPQVCMNPILLKPTNDMGSQVIVNGISIGDMPAKEYFQYKTKLIPEIKMAFQKLEELADIIVIEGAGSPAEINLKQNDIVNMGMAAMVDAPVLLVGDIDRGGVFAQLLGTLMLLEEEERKRVKGLIINKFRGDKSILDSGIRMLEEKGKIMVRGVIPYMNVKLEEEDSLTEKFEYRKAGLIDLAVIRYPRISNFTDFDVFEQLKNVSVRYVTTVSELREPDLIFLPGSKNTMSDLKWMRQNGLEEMILQRAGTVPVFGICGGYQMLGMMIEDPLFVEEGGSMKGMGLLPVKTILGKDKVRMQTSRNIGKLHGVLADLSDMEITGYEIHMGHTFRCDTAPPSLRGIESVSEEAVWQCDNIYGSYIHGFFDKGEAALKLVKILAENKNMNYEDTGFTDYQTFRESQYDLLADTLRRYLHMDKIYEMLREVSYDEG